MSHGRRDRRRAIQVGWQPVASPHAASYSTPPRERPPNCSPAALRSRGTACDAHWNLPGTETLAPGPPHGTDRSTEASGITGRTARSPRVGEGPDQPERPKAVGKAELFGRIVESATDFAIFAMDPNGAATSWNVGAERLFGYAEGEIIGRSADVTFTPEDRAAGAPEDERRRALPMAAPRTSAGTCARTARASGPRAFSCRSRTAPPGSSRSRATAPSSTARRSGCARARSAFGCWRRASPSSSSSRGRTGRGPGAARSG